MWQYSPIKFWNHSSSSVTATCTTQLSTMPISLCFIVHMTKAISVKGELYNQKYQWCLQRLLGYLLRCTIKFKSGSQLPLKDIHRFVSKPGLCCLSCVVSVLLEGEPSAPLKVLSSQVFMKYFFSIQLSSTLTTENQPMVSSLRYPCCYYYGTTLT